MRPERFEEGAAVPGEARRGSGDAARPVRSSGWARWTPVAAPLWSLGYGLAALYWALSGQGFPYAGAKGAAMGPLAAGFGAGPAWAPVIAVGLPAAVLGALMLRRPRRGRRTLVGGGAAAAVLLLVCMVGVDLLTVVGYVPYGLIGLVTGAEVGEVFLSSVATWDILHQIACLVGGFLWSAATLAYARSSKDGCGRCGRGTEPEGWTSPRAAARWGSAAVYAATVPPLLYASTRFCWALGIPLGVSDGFLHELQRSGAWVAGGFLAAFATLGAVLTLGLVQRWGEVFPVWIPGLAGRRVPIALAVVPACAAAVLVFVGGIAMLSGYAEQVADNATSGDPASTGVLVALSGGLFSLWGVALAAAALAYYLRRRGACAACGRGEAAEEPTAAG